MVRAVGWGVTFGAVLASAALASLPAHNYGPLFRAERDERGRRLEALGPLVSTAESADGAVREGAFRPLFFAREDRQNDYEEFDMLYPLITFDRFGKESRFQIFQLFALSTAGREEGADEKFTLFPFVFINAAAQPEKGYWAVVPVYGELKHRLAFDRIFFVAFPLYADFKKRGVQTRFILFPFFSFSEGEGVEGWRLFPFFGYQTKGGAYDKRYVLFPFWISADFFGENEPSRHARASLPFFYREWTPTRDAVTVLWPFFRRVEDRQRQYVEWDFPWPLFVVARGKDYHVTRFVPLYGHSQDRDRRGYLFLYPLWKWNRHSQPDGTVEVSRVFFYVYADTRKTRESLGQSARRVESLPLFQYRRDYDGSVRFQTLALLEPVLPGHKSIERNYSPLWTLFQFSRDAEGHTMHSLLWNLWRWERDDEQCLATALLGLVQYKRAGEEKSLRLLFLPRIRWK